MNRKVSALEQKTMPAHALSQILAYVMMEAAMARQRKETTSATFSLTVSPTKIKKSASAGISNTPKLTALMLIMQNATKLSILMSSKLPAKMRGVSTI